jgi:cytochrome c biogenesis protein CcmG, thiol:disulfide interchange protein DsbE
VSSLGAITLGPLVMSLDRAVAALGLLTLVAVGTLLARRGKLPALGDWAFTAAVVTVVGARLAFVASDLSWYATRPLEVLAIWQGGFDPWWGIAAAAVFTASRVRRSPELRRGSVTAAVSALAVWLLAAGLVTPGTSGRVVTLPDVLLEDLGGTATPLAANDGRPTLVNLWATWCPPCRRELPLLTATARDRADEVRVVLVSQGESAAVVRSYLEEHGLDGTAVRLDPRASVGSSLGAAGLPTTLLFDASGVLLEAHVGEISGPALARLVARGAERP